MDIIIILFVLTLPVFICMYMKSSANSAKMYCRNCGHQGIPKNITKGSIAIEIIAWFCFLIPGIIYSLWRLTSRHKACPSCTAPNMIPMGSPLVPSTILTPTPTPTPVPEPEQVQFEPVVDKPKPLKKVPNWSEKGKLFLQKNEYKEAIAAFSNALTLNQCGPTFYMRAIAYSKVSDNKKAISDLKKSAEMGYPKAIKFIESKKNN